jgi:Cysteine-rich CWC
MSSKHEEKVCPRCKAAFECKVNSIALCQCAVVELNEDERYYISRHFDDCLCAKCMEEMKAEYRELAKGNRSV